MQNEINQKVIKHFGTAKSELYFATRRDEMFIQASPVMQIPTAAVSLCVFGNDWLRTQGSYYKMGLDINTDFPSFTLYLVLAADGGYEYTPFIKFIDTQDNHICIDQEMTDPIVLTIPIPQAYSGDGLELAKKYVSLLGYSNEYVEDLEVIQPVKLNDVESEVDIKIYEPYYDEGETESETESGKTEE